MTPAALFSRRLHLNGELIAVGENGTILASTTGTNWSSVSSGTTNWLNTVDYVNGAWFIAGNQGDRVHFSGPVHAVHELVPGHG